MLLSPAQSGLRVLAVNILGRFLASKDPNIKYVALEQLAHVITVDPSAVARHRAVIVECLSDADTSIRKAALELTAALVNDDNVVALVKEMVKYLVSAGCGSVWEGVVLTLRRRCPARGGCATTARHDPCTIFKTASTLTAATALAAVGGRRVTAVRCSPHCSRGGPARAFPCVAP